MVGLMILLSFIGGTLLAIQSAINGKLGASVGVFKSAFLTFSIGALLTALLIFFLNHAMKSAYLMCQNGNCWER